MVVLRRHEFARLQLLYMLCVLALLAAFGRLSLPLFLTASLVGLIVLVKTAAQPHGNPPWLVWLWRAAIVGLVLFGLYLAFRMWQMVPAGAL